MSEYDKLIGKIGKMFSESFSLRDWLGSKIVGLEKGEDPQKTIIVSGSAHGDCENSLYATVEILLKVEVANRIVVILSRDPTGFHRLSELSEKIFGKKLSNAGEILDYASRTGLKLIERDGYQVLSYGNLALVFAPEEIRSYRQLEESFNPKKFNELRGFYLLVPETWKNDNPRSRTYRISNNRLYDLDTFYETPDYLAKLFEKILDYEPLLFIDLDCWEKNSFCIASDEKSLDQLDLYIDLVLSQIQDERGIALANSAPDEYTMVRDGVCCIKKKVFAKEISRRGIPSVKLIAPKDNVELLTTSALSLINGLAFVPI